MNRLQIAQQIVRQSGHWELVSDARSGDYDEPANPPTVNYFINAAQRYLDRKFEYKRDRCWLLKAIEADQQYVTFSKARYISEVWCATSAGTRFQLIPKTAKELRGIAYPETEPPSGVPLYWAPVATRLAPEQDEETESDLEDAGIVDTGFIVFDDAYLTDQLLLWPVPDEAVTIEVLARWYSKDLESDEDESFWSVNEPQLLIKAARMEIESDLHRNKEGANQFKEEVLEGLRDCYFAMVAEASAGPPGRYRMLGR